MIKQYMTIIVVLTYFLSGCATKQFTNSQFSEIRQKADIFVGKNPGKLFGAYPELVVDEIDYGIFRYTVDYEVDCSISEILMTPRPDYTSTDCYIRVYFFVIDGVVMRYAMRRHVGY